MIQTYLELSTGHVTEDEMEAIDHCVGDALPIVATDRYGAFLYVPDDDGEEIVPYPALRAVVELARSLGVRLIRLDADGPEFPGLKTYDW